MVFSQARVSGYNIAFKVVFLTCISSCLHSAEALILKEYPVLTNFLGSTEITRLLNDCQLGLESGSQGAPLARTQIEFTRAGITKKMILNAYFINKKLLAAEEFKFIFCHELGHIHDKHLTKTIISTVVLTLIRWGILFAVVKAFVNQKYRSFLKRLSIGGAMDILGKLLLSKWLREGELYADSYAFGITGNKEAVISALKKRKAWFESSSSSNRFFNWLRELFNDHPSEEVRIASLESQEVRN